MWDSTLRRQVLELFSEADDREERERIAHAKKREWFWQRQPRKPRPDKPPSSCPRYRLKYKRDARKRQNRELEQSRQASSPKLPTPLPTPHWCPVCGQSFGTKFGLSGHAYRTGHSPKLARGPDPMSHSTCFESPAHPPEEGTSQEDAQASAAS